MILTPEIKSILESEGYFNLKIIEGRGVVGLFRFIFTVGLVYGISEYDYKGRYCYPNLHDATASLEKWDGKEDPSGNWIKHKGRIEYSNPNPEQ